MLPKQSYHALGRVAQYMMMSVLPKLISKFHCNLNKNSWVFFGFFFGFFLGFLGLFVFLGPHLRHMEVPRLGNESELQLSAYITATTTQDPSYI